MSAFNIARLVERKVGVYGAVREELVLIELDRRGVTPASAEEGIQLGLVRGMFVRRTADGGESELRRQIDLSEAL